VGVYIGISTVCVLAFILRSEMIVQLGLLASKSFFQKLMTSIMKAPMSFFDATPSGRILNRVGT
jgi:ABC-type multidrug transport system fused ATPase/permease subunit